LPPLAPPGTGGTTGALVPAVPPDQDGDLSGSEPPEATSPPPDEGNVFTPVAFPSPSDVAAGERSPSLVPTPHASSPSLSLTLTPLSVVSDDEQDKRDVALFRLRRQRLAHEMGMMVADDEGNEVISNRSEQQRSEAAGGRRRRGPRSPFASAVDSHSTARSTWPDVAHGASDCGGSESVHSSPPWTPPGSGTAADSQCSYVSSTASSSPMLHVGSRRRRRAMEWSPGDPRLHPGNAT